jgi:hypothetical protein
VNTRVPHGDLMPRRVVLVDCGSSSVMLRCPVPRWQLVMLEIITYTASVPAVRCLLTAGLDERVGRDTVSRAAATYGHCRCAWNGLLWQPLQLATLQPIVIVTWLILPVEYACFKD